MRRFHTRRDLTRQHEPEEPCCRAWAIPNVSCCMHGGASTGAKTLEEKDRRVAVIVERRGRWVERMNEGKKFPGGRKPGQNWIMRKRPRKTCARPPQCGEPGYEQLRVCARCKAGIQIILKLLMIQVLSDQNHPVFNISRCVGSIESEAPADKVISLIQRIPLAR
jgi:hypothetical protein